ASTLLIFASNTAIIGAYHVFLALAHLQFFPRIVEKTNKLRGTPHVSIALATGIPIIVLIAVRGRIDYLGDMYAFGLLGAFSLTCLALDVIRWRERHGREHIGATEDQEEREAEAQRSMRSLPAALVLTEHLDPATVERLWHLRAGMRQRRIALARQAQPTTELVKRSWGDIRYWLGFPTTALVVLAWSVNLYTKPPATAFGGGLTVLGVAIAVAHYRHMQAKGQAPIFLIAGLRQMPEALLVVFSPDGKHRLEVARAAVEGADGASLVFFYVGRAQQREVRPFEIVDPYSQDPEAQETFRQVAALARRHGATAH